jgi:hypothetical protein
MGQGPSGVSAALSALNHGVAGERWLTILMNRIDPALFSDAFTSWVRETWPDVPLPLRVRHSAALPSSDPVVFAILA